MTKETKVKTKDKILNSARELFSEKGFDGTGVEEIAKKAGVTKSLLYYYYDSKNAILYELMTISLENTIGELAEIRKENKVPKSPDELFDNAVKLLRKEESVLRIALGESLKAEHTDNIICDLPMTIFKEYDDIFHFTTREKLLCILFAIKIITMGAISDNICKALGIGKEELDVLLKENMEPIFGELIGGAENEK